MYVCVVVGDLFDELCDIVGVVIRLVVVFDWLCGWLVG